MVMIAMKQSGSYIYTIENAIILPL